MYRSGVSEGSAVCHSHAILCESLWLFTSYDQVDVSNLALVEQIVRRIIQDERAVRGLFWTGVCAQPDHRCVWSSLNHSPRSLVRTDQRDEALVLKNARQHREELAIEAKSQNGGGRGIGSDLSSPAKQ